MPEPDAILGVAGVVSGVGAVVVSIYLARSNKVKLNAETAKSRADAVDVLTDASSDVVQMYRQELATAREELEKTRMERATAREELAKMTAKFQELTETFEHERQASQLRIWELEKMNRDLEEEVKRLRGGGQ